MATVSIYCGEDQLLPNGYGLGFFGNDGFGSPILKNEFPGRTFVANSTGETEKFECNNNKYISSTGVIVGQCGSGILLTELPNNLTTINIRFEHPTAVYAKNPKFYVFDGTYTDDDTPNINNDPTGVTCYCAEIRHPSSLQETQSPNYSDTTWSNIHGSGYLSLVDDPCTSGVKTFPYTDTRHDWFIAVSPKPTTYGDKEIGFYFEVEFL